ncbi:MAG TPA: FAD:protein FMN transferase [Gemmatimonadaceae bacterium]
MLAVLLLLARPGVSEAQVRREFTEVHMGVPVRLVLHAPSDSVARAAARAAFARVAELDEKMSDYRPGSEVRRLATRSRVWTQLSPELFRVLARAIDVARLSGGAFDPTLAPLVALWREARRVGRLPAPDAMTAARQKVGWQHLQLDTMAQRARLDRPGMHIDLGGIAKGYIVAEALRILRANGAPASLVEAGGDIAVGEAPPGASGWAITIPGADSGTARRARHLTNVSVATSGATEQFVEIDGVRYSHVIDPRTGLGLTHRHVVTVIARDGATADAAATALNVLGPDRGKALAAALDLELVVWVPGPGQGPSITWR